MKERDNYIDFLRCLGIILIILAHSNAPDLLCQIRCFDVPLMIFVSGLSYGSGHFDYSKLRSFFVKRTKRLLVPVYSFFIFYFLIFFVIGKGYLVFDKIIPSFLLLNPEYGFGYVWIIRVFLLIMFFTPILIRLCAKISVMKLIVYVVLALTLLQICVEQVNYISIPFFKVFLDQTLLYILGYSVLFISGYSLKKMSNVHQRLFLLFVLVLTILSSVFYVYHYGVNFKITPIFKYPPQLYYLVYGLACACILWKIRFCFIHIMNNKLLLFIGKNTMWIYLWNILVLKVLSKIIVPWFLFYFLVLVLSVLIYYCQYILLSKIYNRYKLNFLKYYLS